MALPRVLLLEDDPAVRRFVALALESLPLQLLPCGTLAEARALLGHTSVQLVLMDLALPDGSGQDLLPLLPTQDGTGCRTIVFSGAVDAALQRQLQSQGAWRVLAKPVGVGLLLETVREALQGTMQAGPLPTGLPPEPAAEASAQDPVAAFFGGDHGLYQAYLASCLAQFGNDLAQGDAAARAHDAPALQRVAHSLKSVLTMLGQQHAAQEAREIEAHAAAGATAEMRGGWQRLRQQLRAFMAQHTPSQPG
ncbi:MAG: hypothetical protein ABT02_11780 [Comamonadaceae bacterium SCN 68-20]|jgi:CheY-like chemotaxis protein/HPt (histidine-containing phosphotransfer) domain-containing protein|nr:response regulator [Comamonadaceae bacterium]ODU59079.1 MAG: hypothetical protein ABT02_11780 [Comamonadaceae bacterium SCN 68-20]OJX06842.1 MAG: hypothetical protein BGO75_06740 [Burkholderiales bacterium 68-20]